MRLGKVVYSSGCKPRSSMAGQPLSRKLWIGGGNQLDETFREDSVKTKEGNQALIMGKLRRFSMNLIRWSKKGTKNFQATIEEFTDSPDALISMLRQVNFL